MRSLIITVAGMATRFNKDLQSPILKCLYNDNQPTHSLLAQIIFKAQAFDQIIIVGGYLFDELREYVNNVFIDFSDRITLVYNPLYREYGSGYSLMKGIEALDPDCDEVVFAEGDLFFDSDSFQKIVHAANDVLTVTPDPIRADKAVVFYTDLSESTICMIFLIHTWRSKNRSAQFIIPGRSGNLRM